MLYNYMIIINKYSKHNCPFCSDKSDSSDLDSVHSLPVTSNTTKHNLSKVATSSGGTPQASYADIARMATINMSHNSVLNMSAIVPSMLNAASWPSVPPKTPSEPDKVPQDYYPSLDEIQSEKKVRQQNLVHTNNAAANLSLAFEKSLSPTLTKSKNLSDGKKAEAQEEAINKNIQVFKYVQDIEKMHESLTQQEQKHSATSGSHSANFTDITVITSSAATNPTTPRLNNNTVTNYNPLDADTNINCTVNSKDSAIHVRANNPRSRRTYVHSNQNIQAQGPYEEQHVKKTACLFHDEAVKKSHNTDTPQSEVKANNPTSSSSDNADAQKVKTTAKLVQEMQNTEEADDTSKAARRNSDPKPTTRVTKEYQNTAMKHDVAKAAVIVVCGQSQNSKQDNQREDENKKTRSQSTTQSDKEQSQRPPEVQSTKNSTPRPAVILLDETSSDIAKNNNLPTELTFGFEINEQLLLSEDSVNEETSPPTPSPVFTPAVSSLVNKPPPNFAERSPPAAVFEKPVRYDKFSPNYHMQQPSNTHVTPPPPVHPVMMPPLPYMSYPTRFPPPTYLPPPPPPPPGIVEKFHQPKEDFSMLYVAPEEELNVQTYNHDKIVTFVGLGKIIGLF